MIGKLTKAIFGSKNERELKRMRKIVVQINALEGDMEKLTDEQLRAKTAEFRRRLADGATLDQLLPEAFAAVRSEEHTSELQSRGHLVCRLLLEKKKARPLQRAAWFC